MKLFCAYSVLALAAVIFIAAQAPDQSGFTINTGDRAEVARYYKIYKRQPYIEQRWRGDTKKCISGGNAPEINKWVVWTMNYFRAMAGVPADVTLDNELNMKAEKAALIMDAWGWAQHRVPETAPCYSKDGAEAAMGGMTFTSRPWSKASGRVIELHVSDYGAGPLGHRKNVLNPHNRVFGTATALRTFVIYARPKQKRELNRDIILKWPPAGYVPYEFGFYNYCWSVEFYSKSGYTYVDFSKARVSMFHRGKKISLRKTERYDVSKHGISVLVWYINQMPQRKGAKVYKSQGDYPVDVVINNIRYEGKPRTVKYRVIFFDPGI